VADPRTLPEPPAAPALAALWWMARGDWDKAHEAAQSADGPDAAWVHAHLHRIEGDLDNAAYWYRRAGRPVDAGPIAAEQQALAAALAAP
jgi:hypothetical protein